MNPSERPIFLQAITLIWIHWLLYSIMFVGIGFYILRFLEHNVDEWMDVLTSFWLGWATVIAILQVSHLFIAVLPSIGWILFCVGLAGFLNYPHLWTIFLSWKWNTASSLTLIMFCVFVLLISAGSIGAPSNGDFGLYHLQVIEWNKTYPIIKGLGNLHGRLAFNNSNFLYVALMDVWITPGIGTHTAASLLILFLFLFNLWGIHSILQQKISMSTIFASLVLPIVALIITKNEYLTTPDSDLIPFILFPLLLIFALRVLEKEPSNQRKTHTEIVVVVFLSCVGVVTKLSFVIYGTLMIVILVASTNNFKPRYWLVMFTSIFIVGGTWMIRGILLSGYLFFPVHYFGFPVDWRIPCVSTIKESSLVLSWARMPGQPYGEVLSNWDWLSSWIIRTLQHDFEVFTPLLITIILIVVMFFSRFPKQHNPTLILLLIPLSSLIFWFLTAPDVRFAGSLFWVFANLVFAALIFDGVFIDSRHVPIVIILFIVLTSYDRRIEFQVYQPSMEKDGFYAEPTPNLEQRITESGLMVNIPTDDDRCYRGDIPCTPIWNSNLSYRIPNNLQSGFKIVGADLSCPE